MLSGFQTTDQGTLSQSIAILFNSVFSPAYSNMLQKFITLYHRNKSAIHHPPANILATMYRRFMSHRRQTRTRKRCNVAMPNGVQHYKRRIQITLKLKRTTPLFYDQSSISVRAVECGLKILSLASIIIENVKKYKYLTNQILHTELICDNM